MTEQGVPFIDPPRFELDPHCSSHLADMPFGIVNAVGTLKFLVGLLNGVRRD